MRRAIDIVFCLSGLIIASPFLALISVAIVLETGFPVLFRQARVGRGGRPFQLLKFRSMRNGKHGLELTAAGDPRVTQVGRILRKYKLDEIPQLWNVVRGEMALIGPRPEVPTYVDSTDPDWVAVLRVRPGLTDLATLVYRDEERILAQAANPDVYYRSSILPAKLRLSRRYLREQSAFADLRLLWMTVRYSFIPTTFDPLNVRRKFLQEHEIDH